MASGSFQGTGTGYVAKIEWSSTAGTAGSTVKATLYAQNVNNYYFYASLHTSNGKSSVTIDGTATYVNSDVTLSSKSNGSVAVVSGSKWVAYTGNKTITIKGNIPNNYINSGAIGARSTSGSAVLDKVGTVPTMGAVTAHAGVIAPETTTEIEITWAKATSYNGKCTYGIGVSINGGAYSWMYPDNNIDTTSYTYKLPNKAQGTKYQFAVAAKNDVGWSSNKYSGTVTLNKLEAPSINDVATYNPFVDPALTINFTGGSQTSGEKVCRYVDLYYGSTLLKLCEPVTLDNKSANVIYPSDSYLSLLGNTKYSGTFKLVAWSQNDRGSRSSYVSKEFTVNINTDGGATPILQQMTFEGGILENPSSCFVKGLNSITVKSGAANTRRDEGISPTISYSISTTAGYTTDGTTATFSCNSAGKYTVTVTATDSRGLSTKITKDYIVQDYTLPIIKVLSAVRNDDTPTTASVGLEMVFCDIYAYSMDVSTQGMQLNKINKRQYKVNDDDWIDFETNPFYIESLFTENIYDLKVRMSDIADPNTYVYGSYVIGSVRKDVAIRKGRVGINCIPQQGNALEIKGKAQISGSITSSLATGKCIDGSNGVAVINCDTKGSTYKTLIKANSSNGAFTLNAYLGDVLLGYQSNESIEADTNELTKSVTLLSESGSTELNDLVVSGDISTDTLTTQGNAIVNGTIDVKKTANIGSITLARGEFLAMYDYQTHSKRYFWMGRDGEWNSAGKFFFVGEDNIVSFNYNKPIVAPNMLTPVAYTNRAGNCSFSANTWEWWNPWVDNDKRVIFDTESACWNAEHGDPKNGIRIKKAGWYKITYSCRWADNGGNYTTYQSNNSRFFGILVNTNKTDDIGVWDSAFRRCTSNGTSVVYLNAGDTLCIGGYSDVATSYKKATVYVEKIGSYSSDASNVNATATALASLMAVSQ